MYFLILYILANNIDEPGGVYEAGRNTKMHVGSIIGTKLQRIINKTSTKWMEARYIQDVRPQTTKEIEEKRLKSQTVHKDSIWNKWTNASTGANGSKRMSRIPNKNIKINSFLIQNSWIPNSYRVNKCCETVGIPLNLTPSDNTKIIAKRVAKIISKADDPIIKQDKLIIQNVQREVLNKSPIEKDEQKKQILEKQSSSIDIHHGSIENYYMVELLGKGSYATVFLARAINEDNKHVAIKIFDGDKKSKNFKEEISVLK